MAGDHVWLGSSKTALATVRQVVALLEASRKDITEHTHTKKNQDNRTICVLCFTPVLYGSLFYVVADLSRSPRSAGDNQEHSKVILPLIARLSCGVMSFFRAATQTHTQLHTHSHSRGHTHSGVSVIPSWDRQTPPVHHSPVHFIDLSSSLDKSTSRRDD